MCHHYYITYMTHSVYIYHTAYIDIHDMQHICYSWPPYLWVLHPWIQPIVGQKYSGEKLY